MTTKAARRRRKKIVRIIRQGRPPERGVERYKSGKKKHAETSKQAMATAIKARQRHAAISGEVINEEEAKNPLRGYVAGRKFLAGNFGMGEKAKRRLTTGNDVAATWLRCMAICGYPPPNCKAMDIGRVKGIGLDAINMKARHEAAKNIMMKYEGILGSAGAGMRGLFRDVFIADDESREDLPTHMNSMLCHALDRLADG